MMKNIQLLSLIICLSFTLTSAAKTITRDAFVQDMVTQHGFDATQLTRLLTQAKVRQSILKAIARPGEKKAWHQYRAIFINPKRIQGGVTFWRKHAKVLEQAQITYGVPAEIIVAIIGVETVYGENTGNYRVLDALTTLGFHYPKRANFFRQELVNFLLLAREEAMEPLKMKGSYAGAMGLGQFMPSSYRRYAVDFDGDGQRNIWTGVSDAIGSVANYLNQHGWQSGQPVILPTQVHTDAVDALLNLEFKPQYTLQQLKQKGLLFHGEQSDKQLGMVIDLETKQGTAYWVGFQNFYVITRYNRSKRYAMAVYQLAQEIAEQYGQIH